MFIFTLVLLLLTVVLIEVTDYLKSKTEKLKRIYNLT